MKTLQAKVAFISFLCCYNFKSTKKINYPIKNQRKGNKEMMKLYYHESPSISCVI